MNVTSANMLLGDGNGAVEDGNVTSPMPGDGDATAAAVDVKSTMEVISFIPPVPYFVYIYIAFSLLGIVLNSVSIKVLQSFPESSTFYFYLKCLSMVDLAFDIFILAGGIKNTTNMLMKYYWFAFTFAYIQPWFLYTAGCSSTLITVWMTVERFFVIQFPLRSRNWFGRRVARIAVATIVVCVFLVQIKYLFITTLVQRYHPDTGALYYTARAAFYYTTTCKRVILMGATLFEYFPAIALLAGNLAIIVSLITASLKRHNMQNAEGSVDFRQELRITIVLLVIVFLFFAMEVPLNVPYLFTYSPTMRIAFTLTYIINHTINFFTYFISNKDFRSKAWQVMTGREVKKEASTATKLTRAPSSQASSSFRLQRAAHTVIKGDSSAKKDAEKY